MTAIRVGMKLGEGKHKEAARVAWLCLLCQTALTLIFGCIVLPLRHELMGFMTNDPEVRQLASELLVPIVLNFLFAGVVSTANGGILASQGRTSLSAKMAARNPISLKFSGRRRGISRFDPVYPARKGDLSCFGAQNEL